VYFASHQGIQPFTLIRPTTLAEAWSAGAEPGATFLAGGVDLIPAMRAGQRPGQVVWLKDVPGLDGIREDGGELAIGAGATYRQMETDPTMQRLLPGLSQVWSGVANIRVRIASSIGGNIMAANPVYDALPALIALGARLEYTDANGTDSVDASAPVPAGGLLTAIGVPLGGAIRFGMDRSLKPAISMAVVLRQTADGWAAHAAVGCAHAWAWGAAVGAGTAQTLSADADALAGAFADAMPEPLHNHLASAAYRRRMARVLLARQLKVLAG
jgi:carbon-monoxide dehydrogenase medium subunit